jgi:hypothetical protein
MDFEKNQSVDEGKIVVAIKMQQQYTKMLQQFRFCMCRLFVFVCLSIVKGNGLVVM